MTVTTYRSREDYTGNGATTSYPYQFRIYEATDLVVTRATPEGVETTLVLNTDYTVTGVGKHAGGNVVLASALASGYRLTIERALSVTQETDLRNQGAYFAETHEDVFDRAIMILQRIAGYLGLGPDGAIRTLLLGKTDIDGQGAYDARSNRIKNLNDPIENQDAATKLWALNTVAASMNDGAGNAVLQLLASSDQDKGSALVTYRSQIAEAVDVLLSAKLADTVSFLEFGGIGDGVTSDSAAFQRAAATNKTVLFPNPPVAWVIDTPVNITGAVSWFGSKRGNIVKKATTTTNTVTRTYVDSNGVTQTLTWDRPACFNLICPTNSYLVDVVMSGFTFDLPDDASVGVFHAQRVAHSKLSDIFCDTSKFFFKGFDCWMWRNEDIRSRYSKDHWNVNTGTSFNLINCHVDQKHSSGGTGYTLQNMEYSNLVGCGSDFVDTCYRIIGGTVTLTGCGSESYGRQLYASGGAHVVVDGGLLAIYKAASASGAQEPYRVDGAGTRVTIKGTWLGIKNPALSSPATYDPFAITNGAIVELDNIRQPTEISATPWFVTGAGSVLTIKDENGTRFFNQNGLSRQDAISDLKRFETSKSITAGSAQTVFRINADTYGVSVFGRIELWLFNSYSGDAGFVGHQIYSFAALRETSTVQNLTKLGDATAMFNTGGPALGTITATLLRNADNTLDFQLNIPSAFGSTTVHVVTEYRARVGGSVTTDRLVAI